MVQFECKICYFGGVVHFSVVAAVELVIIRNYSEIKACVC